MRHARFIFSTLNQRCSAGSGAGFETRRTGVVATDFKGKENSNKIRILDMKITTAEVRAIVGGELPIMIDNNAK